MKENFLIKTDFKDNEAIFTSLYDDSIYTSVFLSSKTKIKIIVKIIPTSIDTIDIIIFFICLFPHLLFR